MNAKQRSLIFVGLLLITLIVVTLCAEFLTLD